MKVKAMIFGLSAAAALLAPAASVVTVTNRIAVLRVDSSAEETIVAVPWVGTDGASIAASNVVKTANLEVGDQLYYYDSGAYKTWVLALDSTTGVKYWNPAAVVSENSKLTVAAAANTETLARGGAILLKRPQNTRASYFCLYGEVSTDAVSTPITAGSSESPVFNLIAPPCVKTTGTVDLNSTSDVTWANVNGYASGASMGDYIILASGGTNYRCYYKDGAWKSYAFVETTISGHKVKQIQWTNAPTLTCGTGFWYVSTSETVPTITWGNLPVK